MKTMKCTDKELIAALKAANKEKQECIDILCDRLARLGKLITYLEGRR